jgi:hypothetical protein
VISSSWLRRLAAAAMSRRSPMRIRHPTSFYLMILVMIVTASLAVAWSLVHIGVLAVDLVLIGALREMAIWDGHKKPPHPLGGN